MQSIDSKEYSWKWITADELLSKGACELSHAILTCDGGNCSASIYDGESSNGKLVVTFKALQNRSVVASLYPHIFCRRGLFVDLGTDCLGMLIQWREKPTGT